MYGHSTIITSLVAAAVQLQPVLGWNRQLCLNKLNEIVSGNTSTLNPAWIFSLADPNNPRLTIEGCEAICDSRTGFYSDSVPRLIILLLVNMQFAPIGKQRFLMILHLLGDPIHSIWSLLVKLEDWCHHYSYIRQRYPRKLSKAQEYHLQASVMVLAAAKDLFASAALENRLVSVIPNERFDHVLWKTASALGRSRNNELLRTTLAVCLYIFQVVAAFIPAIGQSTSASGGRIAPAMLLSWLLPVILLSNTIGGFSSLHNCEMFLMQYLARIGVLHNEVSICEDQKSRLFQTEISTPYFSSLAWSGAIYSYRLDTRPRQLPRRSYLLVLCSVLPVILAFGLAFAILETAPTYFSCRSVLVVAIFTSWLISATITSITSFQRSIAGKYLWYFILVKDSIVAGPAIALIVATSCGLFNSCYCWSGALLLGRSNAAVALNPMSAFNHNNTVVYPAMVAVGLFLQICVFLLTLWVGRRCFRVMWWGHDVYPQDLKGSTRSKV